MQLYFIQHFSFVKRKAGACLSKSNNGSVFHPVILNADVIRHSWGRDLFWLVGLCLLHSLQSWDLTCCSIGSCTGIQMGDWVWKWAQQRFDTEELIYRVKRSFIVSAACLHPRTCCIMPCARAQVNHVSGSCHTWFIHFCELVMFCDWNDYYFYYLCKEFFVTLAVKPEIVIRTLTTESWLDLYRIIILSSRWSLEMIPNRVKVYRGKSLNFSTNQRLRFCIITSVLILLYVIASCAV